MHIWEKLLDTSLTIQENILVQAFVLTNVKTERKEYQKADFLAFFRNLTFYSHRGHTNTNKLFHKLYLG